MTGDAFRLLHALDDEQRAAVECSAGPVRVLAGAGTGKTRMLTHRIAYAVATEAVPASQVLAVTFTRRAASEMRDRLRALGVPPVQAATFHASALRQLSYFWPRATGEEMPPLVSKRLPLVGRAASRVLGRSLPVSELRDLTGEVDWAKASLVTPEAYAGAALRAHREIALPAVDVARVLEAYEAVKGAQVDFEDLLSRMARLLADDPATAREFRTRYRWFTVDEYQDTSPAQQRLLDAWLGDSDDICVVGDVAQTIYTFAGADADNLVGFDSRYPHATTVRLVRDYRSTPQVVDVANKVLSRAGGVTARLRVELVGQRPPGPRPRIAGFPTDAAEADAVAARCRTLVRDGTPPREIAILVRTNAQAEAYEEGLDRAKVPHVMRGAVPFFDRDEVRLALRAIRDAASGPGASDPAATAVADVLSATGHTAQPPRGEVARERWESMEALHRMAVEAEPGTTLAVFSRILLERSATRHAPDDEAVTVATLHSTKGLEWDAVFLVGVSEGRLPIRYAESPEEVEEERRLLYVGVTRAREHLWISWSRTPSRFLDGIIDDAPQGAGRPGTSGRSAGRTRAAKGSGRAGGFGPTQPVELAESDRPLFEALREWRLAVSREAQTPAFTVFGDATLVAIATARPTTPAALLAVKGVGPAKAERYGEAVLGVVAAAE